MHDLQSKLAAVSQAMCEEPYEINNGLCDEWAGKVHDTVIGAEIWETDWDMADVGHLFIKVDQLFYDAEALGGVADYMDLPVFARWCKRRQPVSMTFKPIRQ